MDMSTKQQWIPLAGLAGTIAIAIYAVVQLNGQAQAPIADFTSAAMAQVRDARGQTVLQGQFGDPVAEDDGLERRAILSPPGRDTDAAGEAEVEYKKSGATIQEVEFTVHNLQPDSGFVFAIDGTAVANAKTDRRGRAKVEIDVRLPAPAGR
jgi:hypothetical protein